VTITNSGSIGQAATAGTATGSGMAAPMRRRSSTLPAR
jgi:hypothetical protein